MIIVAEEPLDRLAIQRSLPHVTVQFASSVEEAEALARAGHRSGFYVY